LELARAFQVPKGTLTYTLAGLEKHGLAELRPNPSDKRSKQVWLTPAGKQFRDEALSDLAPVFAKRGKLFAAERIVTMLPELSAFRGLFDQLRSEITQRRLLYHRVCADVQTVTDRVFVLRCGRRLRAQSY
jgi:DNA-binding MarR family transcriptional regulator